jgi:hypothetical protein
MTHRHQGFKPHWWKQNTRSKAQGETHLANMKKHQDDAKIIYLFFVCISCVSSVFQVCITFDIFCVSVVHHVCVCASVESVVSVYPLCHQSDRKKRRAEVQRQQAMARLQNEMALKEQNSMTLELRAAVEEALSAVFGRYPAEGSLFARQKYGINGN